VLLFRLVDSTLQLGCGISGSLAVFPRHKGRIVSILPFVLLIGDVVYLSLHNKEYSLRLFLSSYAVDWNCFLLPFMFFSVRVH
jgi:hypothetical protein